MGLPRHLVLLGTQFRDSSGIGFNYSKLQHSVIIGQCTDAMIAKLKGDSNFGLIEHNSGMLGLLGMIKKVAFKVET